MKILVINAGSSSLKYQLIDTDNEAVLAKGNCERIGQNGAFIGFKTPDGKKINRKTQMLNHTQAFEAVKNALLDPEYGAISDLSEVSAVGHRVVQGGAYFDKSVLVDNSVINKIRELAPLAPLHNLAHLQGIEACTRVSVRKFRRLRFLILLFTRQCQKKHLCMQCLTSIMKSSV